MGVMETDESKVTRSRSMVKEFEDRGAESHEKITGEQKEESEWITWEKERDSKREMSVIKMIQYLSIFS